MSAWYAELMACPDCLESIQGTSCHCGFSASGRDWRPINPIPIPRTVQIARFNPAAILNALETSPPKITYNGPMPGRNSSGLFSLLQASLPKGAALLDHGCGPRDQCLPAEFCGFRYVGADFEHKSADILFDAHRIPFRDASFDGIISYAVFEHLFNPFVAIEEVHRVLKPGGIFVGIVSQGEPFHQSYFHHTAWGIISLFASTSGLRLKRVSASRDTLKAIASMGRYPLIIRNLLRGIAFLHEGVPILAPRKMKWSNKEKQIDAIHRSGSILFAAEKT